MDDKEQELRDWWLNLSIEDAAKAAAKAREYGSVSLEGFGHTAASLGGLSLTKAQALELACCLYVDGKVRRIIAAFAKGQDPGDDSAMDIVAYGMMMRHIRETGDWTA